ncbi:MAG: virulence factor Pgp3 [Anaerolineales bacterium]|nr:virulence factor Pgp3 [Anaerolineales bacterium]
MKRIGILTGGGGGSESVLVQRVEATPNTTYSSITTALPVDDSIPQNTEGDEVITVTITPTSATNRLVIRAKFMGTSNTALLTVIALFQDATANALAVAYQISTADGLMSIDLVYEMAAGTTSATTFKLRAGNNGGATTYVNGVSAGRRFGGVSACRLSVEEIKV